MAASIGSLWHQKEDPDERAKALWQVVTSYQTDQEARRRRILRNLRLYEGRELPDLTPTAYYHATDYMGAGWTTHRLQLARALVSTARAKIASKQRPKAMFAVSEGDWSTKRKAKKKERFVEAVMMQQQGMNHDAYEVLVDAFVDCCVADVGVVKFWPDYQRKKIVIQRRLPWEFLVDPREFRDGSGLNYFEDYGYDRFKLAAQFPKYEEEIMRAPSISDVYGASSRDETTDRQGRQVRVVEGHRVAIDDEHPGCHTISVGGVDLTEGEEWRWTFPPYEIMTWERWRMGILGTSLVEISAYLVEECNSAFERWRKAERLGSNQFGTYQEGTIPTSALEANDAMTWIPVDRSATLMPQITTPQTMGEASIRWFDTINRLTFDIPGVSQADAQAEREPGLQSGEAQRIVANIKSERFSTQWQMFERVGAIGSTRQILRCIDDFADHGIDLEVNHADGGRLTTLKAKDVNVELPDEAIQIYAVSGLVNTPADRVDLAEKLFNMGILSADGVMRVIQAKDIDRELDGTNAQERMIEKYIESWLDPVTKSQQSKFQYYPPDKWLNLQEAIIQVGRAMFEARTDGCPEWNLQWFVRWLGDCDKVMQKIAAQQAQLKAAAGGNTAAVNAIGPAAGGAPSPPPGAPPPPGQPPMSNGAPPLQ